MEEAATQEEKERAEEEAATAEVVAGISCGSIEF